MEGLIQIQESGGQKTHGSVRVVAGAEGEGWRSKSGGSERWRLTHQFILSSFQSTSSCGHPAAGKEPPAVGWL